MLALLYGTGCVSVYQHLRGVDIGCDGVADEASENVNMTSLVTVLTSFVHQREAVHRLC